MNANLTLANGQVAATAGQIVSWVGSESYRLNLTFQNVALTTETLVVTLVRASGPARRVARAVLAPNEQLVLAGFAVDGDDVLNAVTTNALAIDYTPSIAGNDAPFSMVSYDANGAIKTAASGVAGDLSIAGDFVAAGGDIDAGASGAAGTVDVFPATASKGRLRISATDQTGDTIVSLIAGAMAAARVLTIPDPLADCNFLMGLQAAVARTATADGLTTGTIADGGRLQHITVTSGNADHIVVLPTPTPGTIVVLNVAATGFELRSSTPTTIAINGGTGSAAESAIAANSTCIVICVSATAWKGFFMDADGDLAKIEAAA